jgi:hypothetical protein
MKKLLNTLYVTSPDAVLALEGETVIVRRKKEKPMHIPLHDLDGIVAFNYAGASPALMGAYADRGMTRGVVRVAMWIKTPRIWGTFSSLSVVARKGDVD